MPPAPGRFSSTIGWPSRFSRPGCTIRPIASELPPGGKLISMRIGRSGHALCAAAAPAKATQSAITDTTVRRNDITL